jgi:hypothetical protein
MAKALGEANEFDFWDEIVERTSRLERTIANGMVGGSSVSDKTYEHTQGVPGSVWTIVHGLDKHPSVTVFDSAGSEVGGDVAYLDLNTVTVTFTAPFSGVAYLN